MEDHEVLEAYIGGRAIHAFGEQLHVEGDSLAFDGWWKAAFRIGPTTFAVREEQLPTPSTALDGLAECMRAHGLGPVNADPTLLIAITYTALDLGAADWTVWSINPMTAEADLKARAGHDSFFDDAPSAPPSPSVHEAQRGGARRTAGLAPLVVVAVGIDQAAAGIMTALLGNVRIEARNSGEIDAETCVSLMPDLVLVDTEADSGMAFVLAVRATARGEKLPMVALGPEGSWTPADITVSRTEGPAGWADHIRRLLP